MKLCENPIYGHVPIVGKVFGNNINFPLIFGMWTTSGPRACLKKRLARVIVRGIIMEGQYTYTSFLLGNTLRCFGDW